MFEGHVLYLLRKYLGEYVEGLSVEALRISVWKGDVVLKDLKLKAEALNSLRLPVTVKAGFVGTITLKVPWKSLGKEPVIVLIDRLFVFAHPAPDGQTLKEEDIEKLFEAKLQQIEAAEAATLEATSRNSKGAPAPGGNSWLYNLISTIIGNLKVTISNVHIRYEDSISNSGHPFATGFTLSKLAAVTVDEDGNETFDAGVALDKLRKAVELHRLAIYHDSDCNPWKLNKRWEDLNPTEWSEIFQDGIDDHSGNSIWAVNRNYLVSPINGTLKYKRLGKNERGDPDTPVEKASLVLSDVSLTVTEAQYYDGIKLLETFSRFRTRVDVSHLRPIVPVKEDRRAWWRYAVLAGLRQKKLCYWFSWERTRHLCQLRRRYVQLYATLLQQATNVDISEIREIEKILDMKVIILWRLLGHAKVETVKSKGTLHRKDASKKRWWPFGWNSSGLPPEETTHQESQLDEEQLTKEEWQAINKLLSYQTDEDLPFPLEKVPPNAIRFMMDVSIGQAAARIINIDQTEVLCGRFEQLQVITKLYPKSTRCDVTLKYCGLSSPEGSLAQSVVSEGKSNALDVSFVSAPIGMDLDWQLMAKISPCHVTVLKGSYERFLEFIKRSNAVSPTVAMETATALQLKLEQVTRRAQEQLQMVLEEQSRFGLDIDLDAPKVRIPLTANQPTVGNEYFVLDFGHFTLQTRDGRREEERQSLYSRFYIAGRDMAAFFLCDLAQDIYTIPENLVQDILPGHTSDDNQFSSLLDHCGMSVIIDQIKVPHPNYPSTRVSFQVPNLDIHFSPKRYCKIVQLLGVLCHLKGSDNEDSSSQQSGSLAPWYPADLATAARTLVWTGLGYSQAEWHTCYIVLSGMYLYILESELSQNYQRCCSMANRQVFEVPPTNVGGSLYSIGVCSRGADTQKALESTNTLVIDFLNEIEKANWMKALVQATYRASAPPDVNILGEPVSPPESSTPRLSSLGSVDLVVNGSVIETKLSIYGKLDRKSIDPQELLMLELLGNGGKVNVVQSSRGLSVKTKLHSLKIKDELQGRLSMSSKYLACSVIDESVESTCSGTPDKEGDLSTFSVDEDSFMDALTDFTSDQNCNLHENEISNLISDANDYTETSSKDGLWFDGDPQKVKPSEIFYEAQENNVTDFVVLTFLSRSPDSCLYDGIDSQMSIRMSALEFYCNRPTLVSLIEFGFDLGTVNSVPRNSPDKAPATQSVKPSGKEDGAPTIVKGLLGYGKRRTIFNMKMDVDRVSMFLNKEDGSQLAMFVQEKFLFDMKVHPSSFSIDGMLGNMRFCDMSLGPDHRWGWLCDIRKPGIESLIKFTFQSYSVEDEDFEGHNYSLTGQLSAVRIVFLYRFVQEFTSYFMELATPHTEEAIKFIDKVGGLEWLIQKYEMDGASAIKLDLSLDTPIIIVPKNSQSEDYIQLDLGQLKVRNEFSWHGGEETDPSAVRLDVLHAEINGINMAVGVNGTLGKCMIRDGHGINVEVRRSLRDIFRKVPMLCMNVQIGLLHAVMSDKEYNVITNCISTNLSETPNLPPSFRENVNRTKESIRLLADKVNLSNHPLLSRTVVVMTVDVQYALLELRNGPDAESPLAELALEGLWVSYRTTSMLEMDMYLSILKFSIHDIRPDTKSEMRLMLGSYSETANLCADDSSTDVGVSNLTMLILDYRSRSSFQSFVIRIQQPRILVVLDFLLPVVEYFVPSLGTITGREESLDPKNDPLMRSDDIILSEHVFLQRENFIQLSPGRQLIVDGSDIDEFTYDGCGGTISLCEEFDKKGQLYSGTIIIIGRGKRLRFKNVKIENGALLRRCVYLNTGSSYSVAAEDGVEVSVLESSFGNDDEDLLKLEEDSKRSLQNASNAPANQMLNFTFEAQVVSPEFTFYDSSKLSMDDSLHIEKLLRAKMDFSFMYASKEKDIWARSVVKDLTIEAGSGLLVLEPVDVSWKYTSVNEKTNIVLTSTDVCIHLSLSVASLMLKLQNQTLAALQFGNISPLISCTNFNRIWSSPKGDLPGYNLTFWRPQAPSNYVILGDCVSSRSVPPSQVVVAVSNTYGRVRRPLGFRLVHVLPGSVDLIDSSQSTEENECSIWVPEPPPGYLALGCVVNIGRLPPSNNVVYCLCSDLVTSATFSDCMHTLSPADRVISGFSIWRVDNVIGSFCAHTSTEQPTRTQALDLHHVLLRNPNCYIVKDLNADSAVENDQSSGQLTHHRKSTSGWDAIRTLSRPSSYCMSTPHFERIWWDKGGDTKKPFSIWRPLPRFGFASVGDCITEGFEPPTLGILFKCDTVVSERPVQFTRVAQIDRKGVDEIFFWYPVPPPGYASLGCLVTKTDEMPSKDSICCPKLSLVSQANMAEDPITRSSSSKGPYCWSIWKIENQGFTFLARPDVKKPSARLAYRIADHAKPKARENITAELKLGSLSVSILDSSCGMVTPLFDTTIANINLATHGRFETMNAVLICSIAASTFNRHLESWEPLIEPFDGIFKFETYDTSEHPPSKVGKRICVAATSPLNANLSSANLELLIETLVSWRRQIDIEKTSSNKHEDTVGNMKRADDSSCSALNEDDFQRVVFENKLGCDVYLNKLEDTENIIELLQHESKVALLMPPPRFSDKLNVLSNSTESRYYVVIQIFESKGLPIIDDGNGHSYFCALRLLIGSSASDQHKVFPQSARTRCVKPVRTTELRTHYAKWNEHFIFEVPEQASANLEIEVTNLASKTGKGEVLGSLSIPIGRGATMLKRAPSMRILQQSSDVKRVLTCPLKKKGQIPNYEDRKNSGVLVLSSCYVERSTHSNFQSLKDSISNADTDFWIGLSPDGPWESFTAALPVTILPKSLNNNHFAFEVSMMNGRKHATLRGLAVISNDADVKLEVSLCPVNMLDSSALNTRSLSSSNAIEEVFENQWYRPIMGWGTNPSSDHGNDLKQWSTRDCSYSSKVFFEPDLPSGWRWTSPWKIEKSNFVDNDGWSYSASFQNLNWPSSSWRSSKSPHDFVRRRRWVRSRQKLQELGEIPRKILATVSPHSSTSLPWTAMIKDMDLCLQVRPYSEKSDEPYSWSQICSLGSESIPKQQQQQQSSLSRPSTLKQSTLPSRNSFLKLAELEKKDMLLYCHPPVGNERYFWFSVGIDASVVHTDLNVPVYDWRISFNSILRLENKLPYDAEFAIWEVSTKGNMVERQHGMVPSGGSVFIYSADIRKPIYLTLFLQNGWILEKDAVLILDLLSLEHVSSFWMVQKQSQRRLRVSVEHDLGASDAAPKTLRIFVPYWIKNHSSIPLSYRIVEGETTESSDSDSLSRPDSLSRVAKSSKFSLKYSSKSLVRRGTMPRNMQVLEVIEDCSTNYVMLSPQDYLNRSAGMRSESRDNNLSPARVAISVSVGSCTQYSIGVSLFELENKEHVDIKAFASDGSYYWFSAQLKMASDRTKVVNFLPRALFINRIGRNIFLSEYHNETEEPLRPYEPPKVFQWRSEFGSELLKLRLEGYKWSTPFSINANGVMCVLMNSITGNDQAFVRVNVRSGTKSSRHEVIFQLDCWSSPYRVENRSMFLPIRFRQVGGDDHSWRSLPPNSSASFFWEDLSRRRLLEVLVDGTDPMNSMTYDIDVVMDHQPLTNSNALKKALRVTVMKEGKLLVTQISDWLPDNRNREQIIERILSPIFQPSEVDYGQSSPDLDSEFHVTLELMELGISVIDHMPEEVLYLSVQQLLLAYSSGMGSGVNRLKMRMHWIQVDNPLPFVPMPVLFCPQKIENQSDYIIKFSMTVQTNNSLDFCVYPYVGVQVPESCVFFVNIHEPIIWRLHEMIQHLKFERIYSSQPSPVSVDPILKIGLLNISEIRFRVSMAMSPSQRPRGVLGFWSSLMTALGNMEHMPVRIAQRYREELCMRQSALMNSAVSNIQKDLLSQPLQLLSGVDILGNASSALSNMSKGIAALSMDKKFIQGRMRQDSKGVEDFGDVIRDGGGALAKGIFRGVTGILTKPIEGAKSSGVEGFVQGVGKGIIGAAAQPVSGVLDLLSKTTEGANAVKMKISSAIMAEEQLLRRRLPRAIGGDSLLYPYDEHKATGQAILHLAECATFLGQIDIFKIRGKFASTDAYEDHFVLPKGKILLITHRRVLLLQLPLMTQRKFNPAKDPCSVIWDVLWDDLVTVEMTHGKKDPPGSLPSKLILYLKAKPSNSKEVVCLIKCNRGTDQATIIYSAIDKAYKAYGPNSIKVVSPEFTFYDSSKLSMDDSLHIEKLLRAKMDFSFMYASKEKDIWARSVVKDLTIEAGSGLLVLEPVDVSWKYTSVNEKTNIVLTSTDVCIHLSLSVASLMLKLQNQTLAALQFGNISPLISCTNFNRIWSSPKGDLPGYNLTFWRPQSPSNYVILGDCVSSRSVPPSQVVVAVSNTYGRVRRPLGFRLVHVLPGSVDLIDSSQSTEENECSIWVPEPPPGYLALGCVVNIGRLPPSNNVVYCLCSDLVTSATFSDCMHTLSPADRVISGFSIWRVDNVIGSFCAHTSTEQPTRTQALDLHHVLLRNPNCYIVKDLNADSAVENDQSSGQLTHHRKSTSGWDAIRTLSRPSSYCMSTPHFERIWWDKGGDTKKPFSIWRPLPRFGFASVGDCITEGFEPPTLGILFKCDTVVSERPVQFTRVAQIDRKGVDEIFFWYPVPPPGYASLGCLVTKTDEMPSKDSICCPKLSLVSQANMAEDPITRSSSSKGPYCWSIWKIENQGFTFLARPDVKKPSARLAYRIADHAKPKARENITAELKLGSLSVSILDSSCGMVTPLFDTTIANINLATHGRFETMNAVLICSIAASTFNRHLESWEPLIEPFDGIFKFETYDTSEHPPSKVGKRICVAATSPLNANLSSANLELLIETLVSWRRQIDIEKTSSNKHEDTVGNMKKADDSSCSALNEDDFQRVVFENKLGCDVYLNKLEDTENIIELLQHESKVALLMPPPRFSDKLNVLSNSTESRYYVVIQIFESKGLPIIDDGNGHSYFCALRLLIGSSASDQHKVFPQSARTRCVKPVRTTELRTHYAKWNEHFIFEVPEQASANLEIEVTNLASKTGKGEVLGSLSIPIGRGATMLKRAPSMRILQQSSDVKRVLTCPLKKKGQIPNYEDRKNSGVLVLSSCYVERSTHSNFQSLKDSISNADTDFWIGLSPDGPWESFTAALPVTILPKSLNNNHFAFEVSMMNGRKHATLRGLAVISNDADVKLEVSLCPVNMLDSSALNTRSLSSSNAIEEVFENQWYRPIMGWGTNPSSDHGNDLKQWSTRDCSYSSKVFFEPDLPSGWRWTSPWKIEKSNFVDNDGWSYSASFQNLNWPSSSWRSSKSPHDFVRRRRWVRSRQKLQELGEIPRKILATVSPHSSTSLPWTAMIKDMDLCLQVRPYSEKSDEPYSWSQICSLGSESIPKQQQQQQSSLSRPSTLKQSTLPSRNSFLKLAELEKKDMLLYCHPPVGNERYFWFSVGIDASVVHTDLNVPVYDWRISFNSILRLENKLPYDAEFAIWEVSTKGNMVERQHGMVPSGGSVFIYSADIRKPIYLTLFLQNGWILEKDAVLILDLLSLEHVSSFWMVQKQSQRRLRVSVEHDLGASDAAPKTLRIFVPYWIKNHSSIPLSYRIVEGETTESSDSDSLSRPDSLSRVAKSSKFSLKYSSKSLVRRGTMPRNMQVLEVIEDCSTNYVMLSPQDYLNRSAGMRSESRDNNLSPARVAISVSVGSCTQYSIGVSLFELENKEHVDIKAFASDGSYYWFSAQLKMASDRTKVVNFLPRALFINRIGRNIFLSEYHNETEEPLRPYEPPKVFQWRSEFGSELLKGYKWSTPFSINANGVMCVLMNSITGNDQAFVRVNVRSGTKSSRHEVIFQLDCWSSPYRVENRSMFLPIRFRQVGGDDHSWRSLPPNSSASFFWEDLSRRRLLEVLVDGTDPMNSMTYDIDVVMDHQPLTNSSALKKALRVTVMKEGKLLVTQISDWLPDNRNREQIIERILSPIFQPSEVDYGQSSPDLDSEFHVTLELMELGISVIDHMPEEVLYLSVQQLLLAYSSGMGSGVNRLKMRMHWIQVDNPLPFVPMPVLFCPQKIENQSDYIIKFSMTVQTNNSLDFCVYPYVGVQVPESCVFFVNIHEPIIWRLHEMIQHLKFERIYSSQPSPVSVDPILKIGLLNISEIRFRVSMAMSPSQRPRGVLGFWSSLMTALGNMEHMPVRIAQRYREELCMRQSALMNSAVSNIQKDLLSQPLQLLSGVDILGNASSALSNMSKGIAALSMDKKFIQGRMRQDSKGVEDFGDVIRDGGGALAKGIFRGVTGILTKPIEGAKSSGVEGFVQGVGKGIIGAAAQPVSGVLDLLSKTTEGANAVKMKISSAIMAEEQLLRRRLPRAIGGDSLLYPYDEHKATGQAILHLAECATFLGQIDIFKIRGKFASTDAYEDHFVLPKGKILLITHRRVLLLQLPLMTQRKFNPAKDPCSVIWDVLCDDLVTVEMTHGKKDPPGSLPSKLILYLKAKPSNSKEVVCLIKCNRGTDQATIIYSAIDKAYKAYGPNSIKEILRWKVPRPYAPRNNSGRSFQDLTFG